jgi:hypothetical protein
VAGQGAAAFGHGGSGDPLIDAPEGEEHLRARGGQFAVAQHRHLGTVDAAEIEHLG